MTDREILASFLLSPISKNTNPENTTPFKILKGYISVRVNDLLKKIQYNYFT